MSVAKPYNSSSGISGWRMRLFIANYGVYIALLALLLAATVLTPRLYDVKHHRRRDAAGIAVGYCRHRADDDPCWSRVWICPSAASSS